jgi:hypothetical protein
MILNAFIIRDIIYKIRAGVLDDALGEKILG